MLVILRRVRARVRSKTRRADFRLIVVLDRSLLTVLSDIQLRLTHAMAAAAACSAALRARSADSDADAALVLQRCVSDVLSSRDSGSGQL